MQLTPADPTSKAFRDRIDAEMAAFLAGVSRRLEPVSPSLTMLTEVAGDLLAGGKRLRPAFAYWGFVAAAGTDRVPNALWRAITAIELLHVGVLVHDDVLDDADTRRGRPAAHRQFEQWHRGQQGLGDAAEFGRAMAVLLGDQLLVWSGELADDAGLDATAWRACRGYWHAARSEVNAGQVLDLYAQYGVGSRAGAEEVAAKVLEEKTSRYTVQRPVQFGAAAGGGSDAVLAGLGRYGLALGRAFQLRDDLLGVFADQAQTGKPAAGDLREGKRTVLLARVLAAVDAADRGALGSMLGRPDLTDAQIDRARAIIAGSGAVAEIEQAISADHARALAALDEIDITGPGRTALVELARQCVQRAS
ncbi:MAG: polyprenyl synthetase family protein [Brooklawnia sp.]|uniref:polyprenyl synthetase family protein n=1 Tax=Brooklawnia sp. TaxID=2699740 RepID=UPI003C7123EE